MGQTQVDIRHIKSYIRQHADFVTDVSSIAETIDVDNSEDIRTLLEFLIHWLAYHILGTDQNMARQIVQIHAGESPEEAYNSEERVANSSTEPLVVSQPMAGRAVLQMDQAKSQNQNLLRYIRKRGQTAILDRNLGYILVAIMKKQLCLPDSLDNFTGSNRRGF